MPMLVRYDPVSGRIDAGWVSGDADLLERYRENGDPAWHYVFHATAQDVAQVVERSYVHEGLVRAKTPLTLTAAPAPFPADGTTVCAVTVTPFVPCTLRVDGREVVLTEADPVLELTADYPHRFAIEVAPLVTAWAEPLTVEAQ